MRRDSSSGRGVAGRLAAKCTPRRRPEAEAVRMSAAEPDILRLCPVTVQAEAQADRYMDGRNRPVGDVQRLEQQQIAAVLIETIADLHDPAIALGCLRASGNETRLLQARYRSTPPVLFGSGREILVEQAVHGRARGAAAGQLARAARVHLEQPA